MFSNKTKARLTTVSALIVAVAWLLMIFVTYRGGRWWRTPPLANDPVLIVTAAFLLAALALAWLFFFVGRRKQADLERRFRHELQEAHKGTLQTLVNALDLRDDETFGHSVRVLGYSLAMARYIDLSDADRQVLAWGALLHDVGKIGVRDDILFKPGPLTESEWAEIRRHVVIGHQLIQGIPFLAPAAAIVRHHHERYDGNGYPDSLTGEEIPLLARIFSVADSFDAMTSRRPYRPKFLEIAEARTELTKHRDTQFCPKAIAAFAQVSDAELEMVRRNSLLPSNIFDDLLRSSVPITGELDPEPQAPSQRDSLTGVFTRAAWEAKAVSLRDVRGTNLGTVIFLDMNKLKQVNDTSGHLAGDRVLADLGARLWQVGVEAYRVGGDEFLLWAPPGGWDAKTEKKMTEQLGHFSDCWDQAFPGLSVAWGCAHATDQTTDIWALIAAADADMYRSKRSRGSALTVTVAADHPA